VVAALAASAPGVLAGTCYHDHLATNQIGYKLRQSIIVALRPAIFDLDVATLNVAGFA
jgi:hypothetical protein